MIDVEQIKRNIDCRDLIESDLGRPRYRNNRHSVYKCPLHYEEKGFSLVVYADHWHCFGKCGRGGDAVAWIQAYHSLSFREACGRLSGETYSSGDLLQPKPPHHTQQPLSEPPDTAWQKAARKIAAQAMDTLWSKVGRRAWGYLEEERGLTEATITRAGLGYIPGDWREWKTMGGLNVPCGITIPWMTRGVIWGIKVRRAAGEQRYQQVGGGNIKGGLYLGDDIKPGMSIFLTEGEFDALIAQQVGKGLISAAAIGSAANSRVNSRWFPKFISAPRILIRMDDDQAGQGAAAHLVRLSQAVRCVQVPQGKDVNEFYLLAGHDAVRGWIDAQVRYHKKRKG